MHPFVPWAWHDTALLKEQEWRLAKRRAGDRDKADASPNFEEKASRQASKTGDVRNGDAGEPTTTQSGVSG